MNIISIAALCLTACIAAKTIEKNSAEIKTILILAAALAVSIKVIGQLLEIRDLISQLFEQTGIDNDNISVIFKGLGICYITKLSCDCCRDCGENALASQITIAGKIAMVIISLPLFRAVATIIETLLI